MTLIEIMISLLLGAFLIGGVMKVFVSTRQTHNVLEELSRLQENGRFALDFIARDLRMADYREFGCEAFAYVEPDRPLTGADDDTTNAFILNGTDSIAVRWVTGPAPCSSGPNNKPYQISNGGNLNNGVTDIVEGVENMQILYGVDSDATLDGVANYYVPGTAANFPNAAAWARVVSVRVSLLLRTLDDNVASQPLAYSFNGTDFPPPGDRRIRRVFTSTIALRNRIP